MPTLLSVFWCIFGCSKYDKPQKDGVSFHRFHVRGDVCWVDALRLHSLNENYDGEKIQTVVKERPFDGAKPFLPHSSMGWDVLRALDSVQKTSERRQEHLWWRCAKTVASWQKYFSCAVPNAEQIFSTHSTRSKLQTTSPVIDPSRHTHSTLTPVYAPHSKSKSKSGSPLSSLDWASAAAASASSTELHSGFLVVRSDFIASKPKNMGTKSPFDENEEGLPLSESIIRHVKRSYKYLLERRGLKTPRYFEKL